MNKIRLTQGAWYVVGATMALSYMFGFQCSAQSYTEAIRNTSLQFNLDGSSGGLTDWTVGGVNQLQSQWFYYSIGSTPASPINTIATWTTPTVSTNLGQTQISLSSRYANSSQSLLTSYVLGSGPVGSGTATLATTLVFQNLSGSNEVINLYQIANFGVGGGTSSQFVKFGGITIPNVVGQTNLLNGSYLHGSITGLTGGTSSGLGLAAGLDDGTRLGLLGGSGAAFNNSSLSAGAGNVDYGYDFTTTLTNNASITISELQTIVSVPEPSSLSLISGAVAALTVTVYSQRRWRTKKDKKDTSKAA